jgi:hypothetical protein
MNNTEAESIVLALNHVQLAMPEGKEELADEFYCGVLGFRKLEKPAQLAGRGGRWFHSNGVDLHLGVEPEFIPARKAHPAFVVKSLSELKVRLEDANIDEYESSLANKREKVQRYLGVEPEFVPARKAHPAFRRYEFE